MDRSKWEYKAFEDCIGKSQHSLCAGSHQVDCYRWEQNRVYINSEQFFEGVSESAWNFYIGGYQPAQKWLKDRKGMTLSFEDVKHYQHIIYVLQQTERLMQEIDELMTEQKN